MNGIIYLCINLRRSPDRRKAMLAEARRTGIELSFVQATDGKDISLDEAPGYDREGRLRHAPDLKLNEVACVLSHKAALETFLASGADAAVIFEDDAVLAERFLDFVLAVTRLPIAWGAVSLYNGNRRPLRPALVHFEFGVSLHASAWLSHGAVGWLYSREGAARVHHSLGSFRHAYDTHMGFFWRHGMTALCAHPPVVTHASTPSTISAPNESRRSFEEKELSFRQFLRARRERVAHELRKEMAARITHLRLKRALSKAAHETRAIGAFA